MSQPRDDCPKLPVMTRKRGEREWTVTWVAVEDVMPAPRKNVHYIDVGRYQKERQR